MIKFIASDLDGTLLDGQRRLPEEIFPIIKKLSALGVTFAPASGRQYANLKKLFAPVSDDVLFLCENGALVKYRDKTLHIAPVCPQDALLAIRQVRSIPHVYPMLCCADCAYVESDAMPFYEYATISYTNCKKVDDLETVVGKEPVCKIAVYDELDAANHCIKLLPQRLPGLRTILSGFSWCDISAPEANKGEAIKYIRKAFGYRKEECLAFGDHMNDYEMLTECGHAYVPENAYPPLKALIGKTVPAAEEGGVILKLKEIITSLEVNS